MHADMLLAGCGGSAAGPNTGNYLAVPCVNVSSTAVADDDLRLVEKLEAGKQECQSDEGQGGSQHGWPWRLFDAKEGNHDDLEEHGGCHDVLEDLHPHLQHTAETVCAILNKPHHADIVKQSMQSACMNPHCTSQACCEHCLPNMQQLCGTTQLDFEGCWLVQHAAPARTDWAIDPLLPSHPKHILLRPFDRIGTSVTQRATCSDNQVTSVA